MFVNFLYAADETVKSSSPANSTYAMAMQIVPFALIFVLFYLFLVRPQKKKQKLHSDMLSSLKDGPGSLSFNLAFNTLIQYGIINEEI